MRKLKKATMIKMARKAAKEHGLTFRDKNMTVNGRAVYELVSRETGNVHSGNITLARIKTFIDGDRLSSAFERMAKCEQHI